MERFAVELTLVADAGDDTAALAQVFFRLTPGTVLLTEAVACF
jgi:hypothetical protein